MSIRKYEVRAALCGVAVMLALGAGAASAQGQSEDIEARYTALAAQERDKAGDPAFDLQLGIAALFAIADEALDQLVPLVAHAARDGTCLTLGSISPLGTSSPAARFMRYTAWSEEK